MSAGDGEVGLLAGGGCARRGKRQRSDDANLSPAIPPLSTNSLMRVPVRLPSTWAVI